MKTETQVRAEQRATPAGQFLSSMGMEYYDTESCARRVAEQAAKQLAEHRKTIEMLREIVCRDFLPQIARCTCQDYGQLNEACLLATKLIGPYKKK